MRFSSNLYISISLSLSLSLSLEGNLSMEHIAQKPKEYTAFEFRPGPSPGPSWAKPWQPASQSFKKLVSKTQCWCDRLTDHPFTWATVWCFLGQALATWHPKLQKIHLLAHVTVRPLARRATVLQKHVLPKSRDYPTFEPCEVLLELVYIPISLSLEGNLSMEHIVQKPKEYNIWLSNFVLANKNKPHHLNFLRTNVL